jgi:Domain of unknown function (DUF4386)
MNGQREYKATSSSDDINSSWKGLIWISGILLILNAVLSLVLAYTGRILYSSGYPGDPEAYLQLIGQHQQLAAFTWSGWILIDLLPLPIIIAMFIVLKPHHRTLALLGSLFAFFYAVYDVSVTEINSLTLVSLANGYTHASTLASQASFVGAATYGYYALPLQTVLSFALGPIAYILWCIPMAKSFFGRWTAIIGILVSVIGLIGSVSPLVPDSALIGICFFLAPRLIALWTILLGVQLYRFGHRLPSKVEYAGATS